MVRILGLGLLEWALLQTVIYLAIWLYNDYLATILTAVFGGIALALWSLAQVVEWVERSRTPRLYFRFLAVCFLSPLLAAAAYALLNGGINWLK